MTLTVKQIEAAKHGVQKERLSDGTGLYLRLYPSGKKVFQVQIANSPSEKRRVWVGIGNFPSVGLQEARDIAGWARFQVRSGCSADQIRGALNSGALPAPTSTPPARAAVEDKSRTRFHDVARVWFDRKRSGLKNGKHIQQNWNTVATYALPNLGHREVGSIRRSDIVEALRPIWHGKHETARRTLARIGEIFELAKLEYGVDTNPAHFDPTIAYGRARRVQHHFGALSHGRVREFWAWLEHARCDELTRQFVMLLVLSAKRTGEVRFVEYSHLELPLQTWTTPAGLMKMGREHRVPLSHQAIAIIGNANILTGGEPHLFSKPRNRSQVICENAALNLVKRFDPSITGHGFRATFKTWARLQRRYEKDAIEFALAHRLPPLEEAYLREDFFDERRALMQDWADSVPGGAMPKNLAGVGD